MRQATVLNWRACWSVTSSKKINVRWGLAPTLIFYGYYVIILLQSYVSGDDMNNFNTNPYDNKRREALKKEQKTVRKVGIILLILAVVLMPIVSLIDYTLVGVSGILATVGGILTARSYVHIKYKDINNKNK